MNFRAETFSCAFLALLTSASLLGGCAKSDSPSDIVLNDEKQNNSSNTVSDLVQESQSLSDSSSSETETLNAKLLQNIDNHSWIVADENDLYSIPAPDLDAKAGQILEIEYNGPVLETWPMQITSIQSVQAKNQPADDRVGLALEVLENLWKLDPALHADIQYLSLDLSKADFLNNAEKSFVENTFTESLDQQVTLLLDTYEQLNEAGYLTENGTLFPDGVLLSINCAGLSMEEPNLLSAEQWRSGLGAVFADYTVTRNEDNWDLSLDTTAIA